MPGYVRDRGKTKTGLFKKQARWRHPKTGQRVEKQFSDKSEREATRAAEAMASRAGRAAEQRR